MPLPNIIKQLRNRVQRILYPTSEKVLTLQINLFYAELKSALVINVVIILIMSLFLGIVFNNPVYSYFAVALVLHSMATYVYIVYDSSAVKQFRSPIYRGNMLCIFNLLSGLLWGLFFSVGLDLNNETLVFLSVFIVVSMITASVTALSYYLLGYLAFSVSIAAPLSIVLISTQSDSYLLLGCLLPTAVIAGFGHARIINKTFAETFQLRFEKEELVKELILQKDEANDLRKEAENAITAKSKFLVAVSHDLRQPLQSLRFFTEALDANKDNPKQLRLVENINNSVNVMESLFNALFDISKLDAGIVRPNITDFLLDDFIQPIYNEFSISNSNNDIQFDVIKPISTESVQVAAKTDVILLESIVRNLVSNAFRYTRQGRIWVKYEIMNSAILLEVGDTGVGIPRDQLDNIFEEYYQLTNPDRNREKGLGLGLAIVKRLINILQLKIEVNSEINQGSTFVVTIPQGDITKIKPKTITVAPELNSINVLVIDDDRMVGESLSALLSKWGYEHRITESGDEAEALIIDDGFSPDAILADYQLKHTKTGIESIMQIQKLIQSNIPAIIMTGDIHPGNITEVTKHNIPVLNKPVRPIQLRKFLLHCETSENREAPNTVM